MEDSLDNVVEALQKIQDESELAIIKLSEPFSELLEESSAQETLSENTATKAIDNPTPATLEADLAHYKELFSKLRFSYLEQVTKEKFIRAIVGDPPLVVEHQENVELEKSLTEKKNALKLLKSEVSVLVAESETTSRQLYKKYQDIQAQMAQLKDLPPKIQALEANIKLLKDSQKSGPSSVLLMPLDRTVDCIEERRKETAELNRQIEQLQQITIPRKTKQLERLNTELESLNLKKLSSAASAKEAKRRKEEALSDVGDDLEERGRWWRGVEIGLREIFGTE